MFRSSTPPPLQPNCLSQWRGEPKFLHRAITALSRRKYCIGKEKKSGQKQPPRSCRAPSALGPRNAVLRFSTALAQSAFFLAALSLREFRRATEAGSTL